MTPIQYYSNAILNGLIDGLVIALLALVISLTYAVSRYKNTAAGDYMTLGAYVAKAAGMSTGFSALIAGTVSIIAVAAVAIFFHFWIFRELAKRSALTAAVGGIGVALVIRAGIALAYGPDPRSYDIPLIRAFRVGPLFIQPTDIWLVIVSALSLAAVFSLLYLTPMGRRLRAISDNRDLARSSGIRSGQATVLLWVMVGALCAVGGILLATKSLLYPSLGWFLLMPGFAAAIFGGLGSPVGAVIGGVVIGLLLEGGAMMVGQSYKVAISFTVLALVLMFRPQGLLGKVEGVR